MALHGVRIVPDTNMLLRALRDRDAEDRFRRFVARRAPQLGMASVVEMELRAGARTAAQSAVVDRLVTAVSTHGRCVAPSAVAFAQAGRVLAALGVRERLDVVAARGSFTMDVLLAVTCREADAVLVTENAADFARIQRHLRGFRYTTEWPA